ncbi:MAG: hypothetical protein M3301_02325, partial [Chloroflexota bacterium]|nr:hypothetical protein [Chloroflexota bacterium]
MQGRVSATLRRVALPVAILVVGLPVGIGAVMAMGDDDRPHEASDSFRPISQGSIPRNQRHAQARWESLRTFRGDEGAAPSFTIARGAIQWQANWKCRSGRLRLSAERSSGEPKTLADT